MHYGEDCNNNFASSLLQISFLTLYDLLSWPTHIYFNIDGQERYIYANNTSYFICCFERKEPDTQKSIKLEKIIEKISGWQLFLLKDNFSSLKAKSILGREIPSHYSINKIKQIKFCLIVNASSVFLDPQFIFNKNLYNR